MDYHTTCSRHITLWKTIQVISNNMMDDSTTSNNMMDDYITTWRITVLQRLDEQHDEWKLWLTFIELPLIFTPFSLSRALLASRRLVRQTNAQPRGGIIYIKTNHLQPTNQNSQIFSLAHTKRRHISRIIQNVLLTTKVSSSWYFQFFSPTEEHKPKTEKFKIYWKYGNFHMCKLMFI